MSGDVVLKKHTPFRNWESRQFSGDHSSNGYVDQVQMQCRLVY